MKGATLLSKVPDVSCAFVQLAKELGHSFVGGFGGVRITAENGSYFALYKTEDSQRDDFNDVPPEAVSMGYRFYSLVDCRDEKLFCDLVRSIPASLDLLVQDNSGDLLRAHEISSETILL